MWYKVFYTNLFIPARFAATTYGPFIFIRPSKRNDLGLLQHELTHVKQFYNNPFFGIPYLLFKEERLEYELAAYRNQLEFYPERINTIANIIATKYNLDISVEEVIARLKNG